MKKLYIMQGIPGSGKSTLAMTIADKEEAIIFSTDAFWYESFEHSVTYNFDPNRLGEAHQWNQQRCAKEMASHDGGNIVIDNTNITRKAIAPYVALAEIWGYEVIVVRVEVPVSVAIARNAKRPEDRQIPEGVIRRMAQEMESLFPVTTPLNPDTRLGSND